MIDDKEGHLTRNKRRGKAEKGALKERLSRNSCRGTAEKKQLKRNS
jgi:hypothetical protein